MDLDGNEYPDLLVGAYESAKAVYLKSSPVVHLKSEVSQSLITIELLSFHSNARKGSNFYYKKASIFQFNNLKVNVSLPQGLSDV